MKILHVLPPVKFGGGEAIVLDLILMGRRLGHDERICCLYRSEEFERVLTQNSVPWYRLSKINLGSGPSRFRSKFYSFLLILKLRQFLRIIVDFEPDVVHLHGFPSNFMGYLVQKLPHWSSRSVPMVYTHHWVSSAKGCLERAIFGKVFDSIDYVTGVSQASLESLLRDHPELVNKSGTVNNFASEIFFEVGVRRSFQSRECEERVTFVNVARFTPFKNHRAIVEAVAELSDSERTRVKILLIGDGDTLSSIKAKVRSLSLEPNFEFAGFVPHEEVAQYLSTADVMIFPSHNEGSPIAVAEALAAGLPVLGLSKCKPVVEIAGNAGVFVQETEMGAGIRRLMQVDLKDLSSKALHRARKFDPAIVKQEYCDIYMKVMGNK